MKKLFLLLKSKTPEVGKKIKNFGLGLIGVAAVPEIPVLSQRLQELPDVPQSWVLALQLIMAIAGIFMAGAGSASTTTNPDEIEL